MSKLEKTIKNFNPKAGLSDQAIVDIFAEIKSELDTVKAALEDQRKTTTPQRSYGGFSGR